MSEVFVRRYLKAAELLRENPRVTAREAGAALGVFEATGAKYLRLARKIAAEAAPAPPAPEPPPATVVRNEGVRVTSVAARRLVRIMASGRYEIPVFVPRK
jgi:hypothetical protein